MRSFSHGDVSMMVLSELSMFARASCGHSVDQLAKPTFRSRYAHIPFGSAPLPILSS